VQDSVPVPAAKLTETERVLQLPRVDYKGRGGEFNRAPIRRDGGKYELRELQLAALAAIKDCGGALLAKGVGHGKSFVACLAATALERKFAIILAPASTIRQLQETYDELGDHFQVQPAKILSYSVLSQPSGTALLESLIEGYEDKDIVLVCDEAHKIKRRESARTKRVIRFMQAHNEVAFVALSGTMISKSLDDMAHLSILALRHQSVLPRDSHHLQAWQECMDVDGRPTELDWQWVYPLGDWHGVNLRSLRGQQRKQQAREAFQARFRSAPGVVASREGSLGVSLLIEARTKITVPTVVTDMIQAMADEGVDPNGDPIVDDITAWRHARHLTAGFWYRWDWPYGNPDHDWLDARREWFRWVRAQLMGESEEGYDSPFLVASRIDREYKAGQRRAIHIAWETWCGQKHKAPPPIEVVWVSGYLIDDGVHWLNQQLKPGILWYSSAAVGDALRARGIRVYGAGDHPPKEAHNCAMSIAAHGVGKNLQSWHFAYVLEPPSSGTQWEQLLGRLHRQGSDAYEITFRVAQHHRPFVQALESAMLDAQYIESTSGNMQKLNFATFI